MQHGQSLLHTMRRLQGIFTHQAQDPILGHPNARKDVPAPYLAMALAEERGGGQIGTHGRQQVGIGNLRLQPAPNRMQRDPPLDASADRGA